MCFTRRQLRSYFLKCAADNKAAKAAQAAADAKADAKTDAKVVVKK